MSNSETMLAVGDKLPSDLGFDSEGKMVHSEDFAGKPLIVDRKSTRLNSSH